MQDLNTCRNWLNFINKKFITLQHPADVGAEYRARDPATRVAGSLLTSEVNNGRLKEKIDEKREKK